MVCSAKLCISLCCSQASRNGMGRGEDDIGAAELGYEEAARDGNREEEARQANVIGNLLKRRGDSVGAMRWLRIDYEVATKYLPQKHLFPTCRSLGEVHFLLERFEEALLYQKKHLELANDTNDIIEQQRASTQLGRTYHEMFLREGDHHAMRSAKNSLVDQISQNVKTINEASKVLELLIKDEQKLKRLMRATSDARGTENERKFLLKQYVCLDSLIENSHMILAWPKHQEFAKRKKKVATELCDKEKLSDSFLNIGVLPET